MTDDFDRVVGDWLRETARPDPAALATVRGTIAQLPARRRAGRGWLAVAAVLAAVIVGLAAVLIYPQPSGGPAPTTRPVPPDPAAFAGDPRLAACFGAAGRVEYAFELPHARDYQRHLPAMLLAPELDVDDPAFAVVFVAGARLPISGANAPTNPGSVGPANPNVRTVCILVGGVPNLYENVNITGMVVDPGGTSSLPFQSPGPLGRTWFDAGGAIVPPSVIIEYQGPEHCGWESATTLRLRDMTFIRDPLGVLRTHTLGTYEPNATLPSGTHSTGYHQGGRTIWQGPDRDAIYVVSADHVERWPAASFFGCV